MDKYKTIVVTIISVIEVVRPTINNQTITTTEVVTITSKIIRWDKETIKTMAETATIIINNIKTIHNSSSSTILII